MIRAALLLVIVLVPFVASAESAKTVTVEYKYFATGNETLEQAKLTAFDRAKIKAIEDEFGIMVNQNNTLLVDNNNTQSSVDFFSFGGSQVKGEWIETIGEPKYDVMYEGDMFVITVKATGKIRKLSESYIDLDIHILRNGLTLKDESQDFQNGDDLFAFFKSPMNGFLVVYLVDYDVKKAYCILPYKQSQLSSWPIQKDKDYILFSKKTSEPEHREEIDEYSLTCEKGQERNDLFFIFSPNEFSKSKTTQSNEYTPKELFFNDFQKWLSGLKSRYDQLYVEQKSIIIKKT